jgi:phenylpropionate dioxygenase-like ring-hydroxylating dioxygenase large terminal subunit
MPDAFDWRACWYPVTFCADLPAGRPLAFSLHDEPFVLFRDGDGRIACLEDRCPHRMARLSDGSVVDGTLQCGYHGWQFDGGGACVHIPQWPSEHPLPERACVARRAATERQGLVWIWAGDPATAREADLPLTAALDQPGVKHVDFATDLPYDQGYLIENAIDIAHIHIAHDGLRGGGHRHLARPLAFDVQEDSLEGIRAAFRSIVPGQEGASSPLASAEVEFRPPGLVRFTSNYRDGERIAGLALYSLPLGQGRCRLLYRKYSNFYSRRETWKPRWLEHWTQNTILRQDMALISGQYVTTERSRRELRELWLPIRTSDPLVVLYRKWLDRNRPPEGPWRGFATHVAATTVDDAPLPGTWRLHTFQCASCQRAYLAARRLRKLSFAALAVLLPAMLVPATTTGRVVVWGLYLLVLAGALGCRAFERRFE